MNDHNVKKMLSRLIQIVVPMVTHIGKAREKICTRYLGMNDHKRKKILTHLI